MHLDSLAVPVPHSASAAAGVVGADVVARKCVSSLSACTWTRSRPEDPSSGPFHVPIANIFTVSIPCWPPIVLTLLVFNSPYRTLPDAQRKAPSPSTPQTPYKPYTPTYPPSPADAAAMYSETRRYPVLLLSCENHAPGARMHAAMRRGVDGLSQARAHGTY